ncbi:hypothetical protein [Candidatus Regiella insecticola]|uniref:30S ribosomal protein S20 n=1 Tax=Candidatus Regiella insecticola TaxID=138073 RepID=A0A6L2ZLF1_9ENTR|nr:hypothetical protein [Candidatus Regiella insecticola]GFN45359.1 hypothetical protein RINTU1_04680 [Candidatus Regiella insecticola]
MNKVITLSLGKLFKSYQKKENIIMSNRQSKARNRALKNKIVAATRNKNKKLFYRLITWLRKKTEQ